MKKTVLIGASLVLATSILGACGKESSTANAENQKITQSRVADITLNGEHLSNKKIKEYKKEYVIFGKYGNMNANTELLIKHMALKDAMMKDLGLTQRDIDTQYEKALKEGSPSTTVNGKKIIAKGLVLEIAFDEAYAKKYLSNKDTIDKLSKIKVEKNDQEFLENVVKQKETKNKDDIYLLNLQYLAQKYKVTDTFKYQQNLLNKADIKGVDLPKLKEVEVII